MYYALGVYFATILFSFGAAPVPSEMQIIPFEDPCELATVTRQGADVVPSEAKGGASERFWELDMERIQALTEELTGRSRTLQKSCQIIFSFLGKTVLESSSRAVLQTAIW
jgi:hypothetical protein